MATNGEVDGGDDSSTPTTSRGLASNTARSLGELRQRGGDASMGSAPVKVSSQRVKRSQSQEPVPLKDRMYTTLCRFRYGE